MRTLEGPWLLFDNREDPLQLNNLVALPAYGQKVREMDAALNARLEEVGDDFASGKEILAREGYALGSSGDIRIAFCDLPEPYDLKVSRVDQNIA